MTRTLLVSIVACATVGCSLLGCREARDELAIRSGRNRYEKWLSAQAPFLATLPPSALYSYDFTTIQDGSATRPIIDYYLKAGDWDGLINLTFVIEIDAQRQPTKLRDQRVTFIGLPARETVPAEEGRHRTKYYGLKLKPGEMTAVVARVVRGEDFDDLRTQAAKGEEMVVSRLSDTDDWIKLRAK